MKKGAKVVVIGGGTGIYPLLSGLKNYPVKITAIISMVDDGGSSGILREKFGILPPGDIRQALVALSCNQEILCNLFKYRFKKGSLSGHNLGNLFLTALCKTHNNNFEKAIEIASKILNIRGNVVPITLEKSRLYALLENGKSIKGETNIDIPKHNPNLKIKKIYLKPLPKINPRAKKAILEADFITIGPGDLYTSILPNLILKDVASLIKKSKEKKIYICNLMTKFGETNNFTGEKFIKEVENYLGKDVLDFVIFNNKKPTKKNALRYRKRKAYPVKYRKESFENKKIKIVEKDLIKNGEFIRHDCQKIAKAIYSLK